MKRSLGSNIAAYNINELQRQNNAVSLYSICGSFPRTTMVEIRPPNALAMANKVTTRRLVGSSIAMVKPASPPAIQLFHPSCVK